MGDLEGVIPAVELVACPEPACSAPAEILDHFALASTVGPVEHLQIVCLHGHLRTPLSEIHQRSWSDL